MEHVLMDDHRNRVEGFNKNSKRQEKRSWAVFLTVVLVLGVGALGLVYYLAVGAGANVSNQPNAVSPFLSSTLRRKKDTLGHCKLFLEEESQMKCHSNWLGTADEVTLHCPQDYSWIEMKKVKNGDYATKSDSDYELVSQECDGQDQECVFTLDELRDGADPVQALDMDPNFIDPQDIMEDLSVDENAELVLAQRKHPRRGRGHGHRLHPGMAKYTYFCSRNDPIEDAVESIEEDTGLEDPEEIFISSALVRGLECGGDLVEVAQDWEMGKACGNADEQITLACDAGREARIFVIAAHPDRSTFFPPPPSKGSDPNTPKGKGVKGKGVKGKGKGRWGKDMGFKDSKRRGNVLTDSCSGSVDSCDFVLQDELTDEDLATDIGYAVKYYCSYAALYKKIDPQLK